MATAPASRAGSGDSASPSSAPPPDCRVTFALANPKVAGPPLNAEAVVERAMVNSPAAMQGRQIPSDDLLCEIGAAIGFFEPGLPDDEVESRLRLRQP
jgi:hypothetical protein